MTAVHRDFVPRGAIIGAGVLIATVISIVATVQINKHFNPPVPRAIDPDTIAARRDVRFVEGPTGLVVAYDAVSGAKLGQLVETDGFIRTVLNALSFDRGRQGVTTQPIYSLVRWTDGRISIEDKSTGISVNLGAFGAENKARFDRFLPDSGAAEVRP